MNKLEKQYCASIEDLKDLEDLARQTGDFLKNSLGFSSFMIIHHAPEYEPVSLVFSSDDSPNFKEWKHTFAHLDPDVRPLENWEADGYHYCFLNNNYHNSPGEFLVSKTFISREIVSIIELWDYFRRHTKHILNNSIADIQQEFAALNSQLMHDIQAIIDLSGKIGNDSPLARRIEYQKQANQNFLFWIRNCELIKSKVSVEDLLRSSLELINVPMNKLLVKLPKCIPEINVDVELFSKAFNALFLNALSAADHDLAKIELELAVTDSISPLIRTQWLKLQLRDTGCGIPPDFLAYVMNPFFTTGKQDGHTGFGLPVAKKIIGAHGGTLDIKSAQGMGTIVKIYLPI